MGKALKVVALTALVVGASVLTMNPGTGAAIAKAFAAIGVTGISASMAGTLRHSNLSAAITAAEHWLKDVPQLPVGAWSLARRFWLARTTGRCMGAIVPHGSLILVDRDAIIYPGDLVHVRLHGRDIGATKRYLGTRYGRLVFVAEDSPDELPVVPETVDRLFKIVAVARGRLTALIGMCIYLGLERRCTTDVPPLVRVGLG